MEVGFWRLEEDGRGRCKFGLGKDPCAEIGFWRLIWCGLGERGYGVVGRG